MNNHEQKTKLVNFKEHYKKLKQDIGVVTNKLNSLVSEREAILSDIKVAKESLDRINKERDNTRKEIENERNKINSEKEDLINDKQKFNKFKLDELSTLEKTSQSSKDLVQKHSIELSELKADADVLGATLNTLEQEIENKNLILDVKKDEISKHETHILELKDLGVEMTNDLENRRKKLEQVAKDLKSIETEYIDKLKLINKTSKDFSEREKELKQREKDLAVIVKRIEKVYKELFPNRKLNI